MVASDGSSDWFLGRTGAQIGCCSQRGRVASGQRDYLDLGGDSLFLHKAHGRHREQGRESRAEQIVWESSSGLSFCSKMFHFPRIPSRMLLPLSFIVSAFPSS